MKYKLRLVTLLVLVGLFLPGCATTFMRGTGSKGAYCATGLDLVALGTPLFVPALVDLPVSLAVDTVLLPVDIVRVASDPQVSRCSPR